MICGLWCTLPTPLTIVLFGKLFSRNLLFHTESIGSIEKESHTGLVVGMEGMLESGKEKNEIIVKGGGWVEVKEGIEGINSNGKNL